MSLRGLIVSAAAFSFLLGSADISSAEETSSLDLNYESQPLNGGVLDLNYQIRELDGTLIGTNQASQQLGSGAEALAGEVVDLKAAGADVKETASEIKISLQGEILFDFDKSDLRPAGEPTLTQIGSLIKKTTKPTVV